jgi:hypothetical protein
MSAQDHVLSVQDACDALWSVQEVEGVAPCLQALHQTLLKEPLDSYDPSEAFLAVQGAALRFHPSQHQQQQQQQQEQQQLEDEQPKQAEGTSDDVLTEQSATTRKDPKSKKVKEKKKRHRKEKAKLRKDDVPTTALSTDSSDQEKNKILDPESQMELNRYKQLYWSIAEESLWAAAALASVCVGPSWRYQLYQRRLWLSHRGRQARFTGSNGDLYAKDDQSMSTFSSFGGVGGKHENQDVSVGSIRSFSPMTMSSSLLAGGGGSGGGVGSGGGAVIQDSLLPGGVDQRAYPPIPEVLPAAMLRFAASNIDLFPESLNSMTPQEQEHWITQQKAIAIAQRYLVLALCCESPPEMGNNSPTTTSSNEPRQQDVPRSTEWTIPGAHELVGNMLIFWLRAADTSFYNKNREDNMDDSSSNPSLSVDWWYTLRVARASTDLISTGWRPLPKTDVGSDVVERLLGIAEKGLAIIDGTQSLLNDGSEEAMATTAAVGAATQQSREERLAAPSSVAEAISALASLSSRGLIPAATQKRTARAVCRLHVISGAIKTSTTRLRNALDPNSSHGGGGGGHRLETEQQIFMNQIESCFADTADCLWILFANEASSANAIAAFLEIVHTANVKSPTCALSFSSLAGDEDGQDWDSKNKLVCMEAGTAVRMMSAAAWGRPPDVVGIPHLRNYWGAILEIIQQIASSIHDKVRETLLPIEDGCVILSRSQVDMLSLALDTVVALGHFIDRELVGDTDEVSILEWEAGLRCLEETVTPWLGYPRDDYTRDVSAPVVGKSPPEILERAHVEIGSLLLRVGAFLNKCVRLDSSLLHALIDFESQRKLYIFLFEKAIPHMDERGADSVALAVVCAWSKFGLHLHQYDGWAKTTAEILQVAFTRCDDGSYAHSPTVRIQALKAVPYGESNSRGLDDRSAISALSDGSVASHVSFLSYSQEQPEVLLELTNNALLPVLRALLVGGDGTEPHKFQRVVRSKKRISGYPNAGPMLTSRTTENSFRLEWCAVGLVGKMIREFAGERENEINFVGILRAVAITCRPRPSNDDFRHHDLGFLNDNHSPHEALNRKGSTRLEAVNELELCLQVPFGEQPKRHRMVPLVLDAICSILTSSTDALGDFADDMVSSYEGMVVAIAAIVALARLRLCEGSKVALLGRQDVTRRMPGVLLHLLARNETQPTGVTGFPSHVATFILVAGSGSQSLSDVCEFPGLPKTVISLESVLTATVKAIGSVAMYKRPAQPDLVLALETVTSLCLNTLTSFLLSGCLISLSVLSEFVSSATVVKDGISREESLAWGKTQGALIQSLIAVLLKDEDMNKEERDARNAHLIKLMDLMLCACGSSESEQSIAACRAILSTIPSLAKLELRGSDGNHFVETIFTEVAVRLKRDATFLDLSSSSDGSALIAQETAALLSVPFEIVHGLTYPLSSERISLLFDICHCFITKLVKMPPSYCLYVAVSCMVATINRLPLEFATTLLVEIPDFGSTDSDDAASELAAPRAGFMRFLLSELLTQRVQVLQSKKCAESLETQNLQIGPSNHEALATELDFMERFEVDKSGTFSATTQAAWLCGKCILLTCRIGSSTSRYRGWVEIVVRCPTSRKRVIVRLLSVHSLTNPEAISTLWSESSPIGNTEPRSTSMDRMYMIDAMSTSTLNKAMSAMARFDLLMSSTGQDEIDRVLDPLHRDGSAHPQASPRNAGRSSSVPSFGGSVSQTHSTSNQVSDLSTHIAHCEGRGDHSINGWLSRVFDGDMGKAQDVKQALRRLNFPNEVIYGQGASRETKDSPPNNFRTSNRLPVRRLQQGPRLERAISVLDRTAPSNTHKMGLLYAGQRRIGRGGGANPETLLFEAKNCSPAYHKFSQDLGTMVLTRHLRYFSAGLDVSSYQSDGEFTRAWVGRSDVSSLAASMSIVVYHVVNLMPEGINNRKRHVGNDNILIVFVDVDSPVAVDVDVSDAEQHQLLVSGHFGFLTIYVTVLPDPEVLRVTVRMRQGMPADLRDELVPFVGDDIIVFQDAAAYVRSLAIRADIACRSILDNLAPASNCHERYRILREMSRHVIK